MPNYCRRLQGFPSAPSSNCRDNLLSFLSPFAQGTAIDDEPTMAVLITYFLTQITLFSNINQIASFVTMTFLLTFMVVNLACFLLKSPFSQSPELTVGYQVHLIFVRVSITSDGILHLLGSLYRLRLCILSMEFMLLLRRRLCSHCFF